MISIRIKYRTAKKIKRLISEGPTVGTVQYLGRQVYYASKTKPGGNYSNPKRPR